MVHDAAATGFERKADAYARARPAYHPELVTRVVKRCAEGVVVDLGAGTGISMAGCFSRLVTNRPPDGTKPRAETNGMMIAFSCRHR